MHELDPKIRAQIAAERRLVERCKALIEPLLAVAGFEARIVLYPRERPRSSADRAGAS